MRRAIAIDFDGCICQSKYPEIGEPNWHVIEEAKKEQAAGAGLILWTCRAGKELDAAIAACKEWGLNFDTVNQSLPEWIEAWGFEYKTCAFVWIKKNRKSNTNFWGMGAYTRANAEICLLGVTPGFKPAAQIKSHAVHQVIESPVEEHSRKPEETRRRIVELLGDVPRIELLPASGRPDGTHGAMK